jgi:nucleoside-diphosphate-sugar epimerase
VTLALDAERDAVAGAARARDAEKMHGVRDLFTVDGDEPISGAHARIFRRACLENGGDRARLHVQPEKRPARERLDAHLREDTLSDVKALVIGGTGFISHAIVIALARAGHDVACFHRGARLVELPDGVTRVLGDRRRIAASRDALVASRPEIVVDCVAFNEADATSLLETFRDVARRAVVLSSMDVYRAWGRVTGAEPGPHETMPLREDAPLRESRFPRRAWAAEDPVNEDYDKIPVEEIVLGSRDVEGVVLRLPMVYGPGDYKRRRVATYRDRMSAGETIELESGFARWRSTRCYVDDVASAVVAAVESPRATGVYNVGEPDALSEVEWIRAIARVHGFTATIVESASTSAEDYGQDIVLDTTRIREELAWMPRTIRDDAIGAS